jgi:AraC-like DNA-binding protein
MASTVDIKVPGERVVVEGRGFRASEVVCTAGPHDRPFEEEHALTSVSVVLDGVFSYRSPLGRATMTPGALLLSNRGSAYRCSHAFCRGDRCLSFQFAAELVEETAADIKELRRATFNLPRLPPRAGTIGAVDAARRLASGRLVAAEAEALAIALLALALTAEDGGEAAISHADERRVAALLAHLHAHFDEPIELADLAALVGVGRHHVLRLFRRVVGTTPHAYLLGYRLRRAAAALEAGGERVVDVALANGFSDLSDFTRRFRAAFGAPPAAHRRRMR